MSWIKLLIHPEHEKVLRIADLTGTLPDAAFVGCVRWFRWVDAHVENATTGISVLSFRVVTRWADDGLSRAMLHDDVEWLEKGSDGLLRPTRPSTHFGQSAKQRGLTAKRVEKHRSNARCNALSNAVVTQGRVLEEKREENTKTERGDAGGSVRIPVAAVSATTPPDESDPVWAAMDAWAHRSRGRATDAAHNEHAPIRMAIASWEQEPEYPTGVPWNTAVCRCIRAAMGSGTKFGDSPRYAIKIVNGLLSAWRQGTPPEPPASSVSGPRFVPDDEAEAQEARLRVQREAKAKAKQNGVHK